MSSRKQPEAAKDQERRPENGSGDACDGVDRTNLIVNYLPQSTSNYDLIMLFKFAGELESVKIIRHPRTGYSYGYGFVKYTNAESAANAIDLFDRLPYRNKILKVSYSRPSSQVSKNSNLYISNLPKVYNEQHLLNLFGQYGEIIQHRLLRDRATSMPRGVAFVRFASSEHAQDAIRQLNGVKLAQSPLQVRIADDFSHQRATSGYDAPHAQPHFDLRGLPPLSFVPRSFALPPPAMLRANPLPARFVGGGGDFNAPFPMPW